MATRLEDDEYRKLGNGGVNPEGKFHLEGIPHILCPGVNDKHDISKPVVSVQFKLNVQIEEKTQIEGKIGGILNVISASFGGSKEDTNKSVQEISFSIPVALPSRSSASADKIVNPLGRVDNVFRFCHVKRISDVF